jgi:uncharacterized protein DUF4381
MSDTSQTAETTSESLVDLMNQLIEPTAPTPIPMTPQTIGWVWLLVGILLALALVIRWRVRLRHDNAYRKYALDGLDAAGEDTAAIAAILRRTALAAWPRTEVANLTGDAWIAFLDATGGQGQFSGQIGDSLIAAPYRNQPQPASPELQAAARRWIIRHKAERSRTAQ